MQEIRHNYDDERVDDRVTERPTQAQIDAAFADAATEEVRFIKPCHFFTVRVKGQDRRYWLNPEGEAVPRLTRAQRRRAALSPEEDAK